MSTNTQTPASARQSDEQLMAVYQRTRQRGAFEELVRRYEREIYSYLRRYLGNAALAEDAFQGTFMQLHLKCEQFDVKAKLRPWLYTIATHQAIDVLRKTKRHQMVSLDRPNRQESDTNAGQLRELLECTATGPQEHLHASERKDWIRGEVANLPEHLRSVVTLAYYQGLKYREVAEVLQVPVGTVKSRLHAAIQKLNEAWQRSDLSVEG